MKAAHDPRVRAALLAATFAQQIGIAVGNFWEPPIARSIHETYRECGEWATVERIWRERLGL